MKNYLTITAILLLALLAVGSISRCSFEQSAASSYRDLIDAYNDSLKAYRNERGQLVAQRRVVETDYQTFRALVGDSLKQLAEEVDKQTASATYWKGVSRGTVVAPTITAIDTQYIYLDGDTVDRIFYPRYYATYEDEWLLLSVEAARDSTTIDYKMRNILIQQQEWKRESWLKKPELFVTVTNLNPNTVTEEVLSFKAMPRKKRFYEKWWFWGLVGLGAGAAVAN